MVTTHFDLVTGPFWAYGGSKRARFGPERPFLGLRRSKRAPVGQIWSQLHPRGLRRLKIG